MKTIILFLLFIIQLFPQLKNLSGYVRDYDSKEFLQSANVLIKGGEIGSATDKNGRFYISGNFKESDTLTVSFLGYQTFVSKMSDLKKDNLVIELHKVILPSQTILIQASVGKKGTSPIAFDKIDKKEIKKNYIVQDIPEYLSQLPSTTFYSENGNGIGYNYLSIRGFDQRRISVSVNGIPQNEPEDHNVYWLDMPDLLSSTELIQVQRGSGAGVIGYPSVGGSINIITSPFSEKPSFDLSTSYGSFVTRKYSISLSSGLINNKYSIYAKLSQILSSGYRDLSWTKFNSFHLSVVRYDDKLTSQINIFGGPVSDGLAYTGLAKFAIKDKELRKANYSDWGSEDNSYTYTVKRRVDEIENFSQPHFELLNEYKLDDDIKLNSALFLILGSGFFDYDGSWAIPDYGYDDYFRLKLNGYDSSYIPGNALIRAQVDNKQFGWIPRISLTHKNGQLIFGGEFRFHRSEHWGSIIYADNLPEGVTKDYKYYYYNGAKDILNGFVNETYNVSNKINLLAEFQLAYHRYRLYNEKYVGTDFSVDGLFINPRVGVNYKFTENHNVFISYARVTREPRLKNYYDAAESSGGEIPQFELNTDGSYNFNKPLVKPETMNDLELGTSIKNNFIDASFNIYYMLFQNEIVKNGKVDRFGQPITGNVEQTTHRGIEISFVSRIVNGFEIFGNATYSQNKISSGKYYINDNEAIDISGNKISGFPDFLANFGVRINYDNFYIKLNYKYVGKFYSDNFDSKINDYLNLYNGFINYSDNVNDSYSVFDFYAGYELSFINSSSNSKLFLQINNIFDELYSAYAIGKEYFPAAERNFIAGIQIGL